jgi:hypothetical protein
MDSETLFFVCGIGLAVSAVLFTVIALRIDKFPGRAAPLVVLWFVALVGGATTFAVLHAQDEQHEKAAELSKGNEESLQEESQ